MRLLLVLMGGMLISASPAEIDALRAAQQAVDGGDWPRALEHIDRARAAAPDSLGVAYQRGCVLMALDRFAKAEREFGRVTMASDQPPQRLAAANYNRGCCQGRLATTPNDWLGVVTCFEVAKTKATEPQLRDDAEHNLELAKLRWAASHRGDTPGTPGGDEQTQSESNRTNPQLTQSSGKPTGETSNDTVKSNDAPRPTDTPPRPGAGNLPVLRDDATLVPLTTAETNTLLAQVAERLTRQRQAMDRLKSTPPRPRVRDW